MIYLNNAATSFPKAPGVAKAVYDFIEKIGANSNRSSGKNAILSSSILFKARENLAEIFNLEESESIIFTKSATEALNILIINLAKRHSTILTSEMEHNSVMRPLNFLEERRKLKIVKFKSYRNGFPDLADYEEKIKKENPNFIITTAASNVNGVIFPYEKMAEIAKKYDKIFCLDAAQLAGSFKLNLSDDNIDAAAFPGHKGLLGPQGIGGLYFKEKINLQPLICGGTGSKSDSEFQPEFLPDRFESGTPNLPGLAGLKTSTEFILETSLKKIRKREEDITNLLVEKLTQIDEMNILTDKFIKSTAVVSISTKSKESLSALTCYLENNDIAVRDGFHCAPSAHKTLGTYEKAGTIRLSPGYFTKKEEINVVTNLMKEFWRKYEK